MRNTGHMHAGSRRRVRADSTYRSTRRKLLIALGVGAFAASLPVLAQQSVKIPRIGVVEFGAPPESGFARTYLAALKQLGYAEPATLQIERRYARGDATRFAELVQDLAARKVDLVFTVGNDIAQVAKQVAPALPVVTAGSEDPVMGGLIGDYRRPGGNVTGITYLSPQLAAKRLELLKEAVPGLTRVAVLWDPAHFDTYYRDMEPAARALGVRLQLVEARSADEIDGAVAAMLKGRAEAMFVTPSRMLNLQAKRIGQLALGAKLPLIAAYANFTEAGGLISYGAVAADMLARAAAQTDKILKGAKAGDLPFEQAATFELVINMKTAKALGIKIPQSILVRADKVIE
jgi:putative ABC transport system substrate-binding protein